MRRNEGFDARQERFVERLAARGPGSLEESGTIVVLPSITFPSSELRKIVGIQHYEERMLFATLWLDNPGVRIVYLSCLPIDPAIVEYYLSFLDDPIEARRRLTIVSLSDPAPAPLTAKLLASPHAIEEIAAAAGDPDESYIFPFNVTDLERDLADRLGLPLYGPHPDLAHWGSKTGSRRAAYDAGVPVLAGAGDLYSLAEIRDAMTDIRARSDRADAVVIKLNYGFSGQGNAIVELAGVREPLDRSPTVFCAEGETWPTFAEKIVQEGAIVEELIRRPGVESPSVQVRIAPGGGFEIVSTHDQVLGGPDGQIYLGCTFPADARYRAEIQQYARAVARVLADEGVIGLFGIDFVVVPGEGAYLSEINLRAGGTTHPFFMSSLATGGTYDAATGELLVGDTPRVYVSTDNLKKQAYRALDPAAAVHAVEAADLGFDHASASGATLHLLGATAPFGKIGMVCIAPSRAGAAALEAATVEALDVAAGA